jgi:sorting nexin-29
MLRKDSDANTVTEEDSSLDYHRESQEYQSKLVQVAEMHAELMEFNARLTIQLTNKSVIYIPFVITLIFNYFNIICLII